MVRLRLRARTRSILGLLEQLCFVSESEAPPPRTFDAMSSLPERACAEETLSEMVAEVGVIRSALPCIFSWFERTDTDQGPSTFAFRNHHLVLTTRLLLQMTANRTLYVCMWAIHSSPTHVFPSHACDHFLQSMPGQLPWRLQGRRHRTGTPSHGKKIPSIPIALHAHIQLDPAMVCMHAGDRGK